ncbi:MAG: hypothetical protein AAF074_03335 [Pseudomonadota bacterium]
MTDDRAARRDFLVKSLESHIAHIRTGQARRFEILRYTFIGFFAYFAFLLSVENTSFLCLYPFETVVLIPVFLLIQVFLYIWIVNWNIAKHGRYIGYLFENGLQAHGLGPNLYGTFMATEHLARRRLARALDRLALHASQGVLVVLAVGCVVLYAYVDAGSGFAALARCTP